MKIFVCVKQVPDTNLQIKLNKEKNEIDRDSLSFVMNPYDEFAVEEAIRIKERYQDSQITVVTLGPPSAEEVLRQALAMGVDEAIHIVDPCLNIRDGLITSRALASVIATHKPELVLCGRQAVDDDAFQVGGALGEFLGYPEIAIASKVSIDLNSRNVEIERMLEGGVKQVIALSLPCVITCQKGINDPRYPSLPGIMKAKHKEVKYIKIEDLGLNMESRINVEKLEIPMVQRKLKFIDGDPEKQVKELVLLLRDDARVI